MTKPVNLCFRCEDCGVRRSVKAIVILPVDNDHGHEFVCRTCHMERTAYKLFMLKETIDCLANGYNNNNHACRSCENVSECGSERNKLKRLLALENL